MKPTVLVRNQKLKFQRKYRGVTYNLTIRHDDDCGNGHNSFAITYHVWNRSHTDYESCGTNHELVSEVWPEYAHLTKWHCCSTDSPMHYIANTMYHAGDRDCNGLKKGEVRQLINGRSGLPAWRLATVDHAGVEVSMDKYKDSEEQPTEFNIRKYVPWTRTGEGKTPDLEAARRCANWPNATLDQLRNKLLLEVRLPALQAEFQRDVESLGMVW